LPSLQKNKLLCLSTSLSRDMLALSRALLSLSRALLSLSRAWLFRLAVENTDLLVIDEEARGAKHANRSGTSPLHTVAIPSVEGLLGLILVNYQLNRTFVFCSSNSLKEISAVKNFRLASKPK